MKHKIKDLCKPELYKEICDISNNNLNWNDLNNKNILVTGAAGFISYYMILGILNYNDLFGTNIKIVALVRNEENARKKFGDVLQRKDIELLIRDVCQKIQYDGKINYIIHAASPANNMQFNLDPVGTINTNLLGTINILEFAKNNDVESILYISSLKIYGNVNEEIKTIKESYLGVLDNISYKNCYAVGKQTGEELCACYHKQYELPIRIVRPGYIYGASNLEDDRVWAQFIANIVRNENILLKSNGLLKRSFCYVTDTVNAILLVMLKGKVMDPYNISSEKSNVRIRDFAQIAADAFPERKLKLIFQNSKDENSKITPKYTEVLDSTKLMELGWYAQINIDEGVRRAVSILENERVFNYERKEKSHCHIR